MRHVLFVDDQDAVLSGLRRMLYGLRDQWRMTFVTDGATALATLAVDPADVVVADMHMRGMDGATLLGQVQRRWPETVRIILSGYADDGAALRSVPVTHQFLSKPCEPAVLSATIRSACELQQRLSRPELRRLIGGLGALPSAPRSYAEITDALAQPEVCLNTVASIIERDPGCSAKLLQLVNSAFFGLARTVTQVRDAVAYLGITRVRDVVLAAEIAGMFQCASPTLIGITEAVGAQSAQVAQAARASVPRAYGHDAFIAGVLHDVGRLALAAAAPEEYTEVLRGQHRYPDLTTAEIQAFGAGHADVGAYLLRLWGLPFTLIDPVARHHDPDAATDDNPIVSAIAQTVTLVEAASGATASEVEVCGG